MSSIPVAILWEFWRKARWRIILVVMGFAWGILTLTGKARFLSTPPLSISLHFFFVEWFAFFLIMLLGTVQVEARGQRLGFPPWSYVLPVSTRALVGWRMLFPVLTVAALYALMAISINVLANVSWPVWGPALFQAAVLAATQAVIWSLAPYPILRAGGCLMVGVPLLYWLAWRYGAAGPLSLPTTLWASPSLWDVLTLSGVLVLAYAMAVVGVSRDRRGQVEIVGDSSSRTGIFEDILPRRRAVFRSPYGAHLWFEWSRKGTYVPILAGVGVMILLVFSVLQGTGAKTTLTILFFFVFLIAPLGLTAFAGFIAGQCGPNPKNLAMDNFLATRPLSDTRMTRIILKTGGLSVLLAGMIGLIAMAGVVIWLVMTGESGVVVKELYGIGRGLQKLGWWYIPPILLALCLAGWMILGLTATLGLTGRRWVMAAFFIVFYLSTQLLPILVRTKIVSVAFMKPILHAVPIVLAAGVIVLTAMSFVLAVRRRLLSKWALSGALAAWIALSATYSVLAFRAFGVVRDLVLSDHPSAPSTSVIHEISLPSFTVLYIMAFIALALAPMAVAPLALYWNRHR